ncbi:hypothetical protein FKM82_013038 [Ascaphus truei]
MNNQRPTHSFQAPLRPGVLSVVREAQRQTHMGGSTDMFPPIRPTSLTPPVKETNLNTELQLPTKEARPAEAAKHPAPALSMGATAMAVRPAPPIQLPPPIQLSSPIQLPPPVQTSPSAQLPTPAQHLARRRVTKRKRLQGSSAQTPRRYPLRVRRAPDRLVL